MHHYRHRQATILWPDHGRVARELVEEMETHEEKAGRPSAELRKYEEAANEVFDMYRERYYSGPPAPKASLSSAYFWDPVDSDASMAGCILFHNVAETAVRLCPSIPSAQKASTTEKPQPSRTPTARAVQQLTLQYPTPMLCYCP